MIIKPESWEKLLKNYDFQGMAEAYEKEQIRWNAENWKKFIRAVENRILDRVEKEVIGEDDEFDYIPHTSKAGIRNGFRKEQRNRLQELLKDKK